MEFYFFKSVQYLIKLGKCWVRELLLCCGVSERLYRLMNIENVYERFYGMWPTTPHAPSPTSAPTPIYSVPWHQINII